MILRKFYESLSRKKNYKSRDKKIWHIKIFFFIFATRIEAVTFFLWCVKNKTGRYPSGQRGQTVNLLAYAFVGSNPALPTDF